MLISAKMVYILLSCIVLIKIIIPIKIVIQQDHLKFRNILSKNRNNTNKNACPIKQDIESKRHIFMSAEKICKISIMIFPLIKISPEKKHLYKANINTSDFPFHFYFAFKSTINWQRLSHALISS